MDDAIVFVAAAFGGAVGAVAGFGIGSLLTPALAVSSGTRIAVAAVSIPHAIGTAIRFWRLRGHVDRQVLRSFGSMSAAGGLAGALLNTHASGRALELVFGGLLTMAGALQLTGYANRWRLEGAFAWIGGALSGFFGGLVGNQGGVRSAAMLGFDVDKRQFVATATAVALLVDAARVPVYLATEWRELAALISTIAIAIAGVVIGTLLGGPLLQRLPERYFRRLVGTLILLLGLSFLLGMST